MNKALTLFDNFNQLTPYAVGFDRLFNDLQRYTNNNISSTGFPPYNISQHDEDKYTIELALAGFGKEDLEVEVKAGTLTVRSLKESDDSTSLLHKGIAYRKFERKFTLADDIIVNDASLNNGMLTIKLERIVPEDKKPRMIHIH